MSREEWQSYIEQTYNASAEYPWESDPGYAVFRHAANRKWFALIMRIPRARLGLGQGGDIDVVNVKCSPIQLGAFRQEAGVYPAYHMNKEHWLTVALDGSASEQLVKLLLDISFELTAPRAPRRKNRPQN